MNSIRDKLREERLRLGLTIEQISEATKINPGLLEAIEANEWDRLPGAFFTRSFIRQFADALGIDPAEL
ncbi:MAG TPA: helix-turn-helix transcriptional regulator, partial [Bryobacteraceae bacterium]|nr:helix-turn-helix transcriptional regulator [Bryobacteraceae bacterium]